MFEFIASLLRSIVLAPWLILRPLLRGSSPSTLPPSARAKARIQAQKANAKPQPQAPSQQQRPAKVKKARMEPASASASVEDRPKLAEQAPAKVRRLQSLGPCDVRAFAVTSPLYGAIVLRAGGDLIYVLGRQRGRRRTAARAAGEWWPTVRTSPAAPS